MTSRDVYDTGFDEDCDRTLPTDTRCPECDGQVRSEGGERVCTDCGLVIDDHRIDHGPEWRQYDAQKRRRTGPPRTAARHDHGLDTRIGGWEDAQGNSLDRQKRRQLGRLRREQKRARFESKAEQNLAMAMGEIRRLCGALDLPDSLRDQACTLYRSAQNEDLITGRTIEAMAAASVYAVCRVQGLPRSVDEIASHSPLTAERVQNSYDVLNVELGLPTAPLRPEAYLDVLVSDLECSATVRERASELVQRAVEADLANGRNPRGVVAAAVYMASREFGKQYSQGAVARAAEITPNTLRARWEELRGGE